MNPELSAFAKKARTAEILPFLSSVRRTAAMMARLSSFTLASSSAVGGLESATRRLTETVTAL